MRVEFSQVLRVLVHEIRGPLGILQGYLRLLKDGRLDANAAARTVNAMLDATGRLSTLTRETSELIPWYEGPLRDTRPLPIRVLVDQTLAAVGTTCETSVTVPEDVVEWRVHTGAGHALSAALAAIVDWTSRQGSGPVPLTVSVDAVKSIATVTIGPPGSATSPASDAPPRSSTDTPSPFAAGGHGLALVLAGVVLESHGADVRANDRQLMVRFPATRGV